MQNIELCEDLYSRQLYTYGTEAMKNMANASVLFVGLSGLGSEIAKNVVLSGVKSCVFYDNSKVEIQELSCNPFLTLDDISKSKADCVTPRLQELNPLVACSNFSEDLTPEFLSQFTAIVCSDLSFKILQNLNEITHSKSIPFIAARTAGLFGYVFNDFGSCFKVFDSDGEECIIKMIASITEDGTVTCIDESRHGLQSGDFVTFSEIEGITDLNNCPPREITVTGPFSFNIGNVSGMGSYTRGGLVRQVKTPRIVSMKSLLEEMKNPSIMITDYAKIDRGNLLHCGFQALDSFSERFDRLPFPQSNEDLDEFLKYIDKDLNRDEKRVLSQLCSQSRGMIPAMQSVLGGLAAQEVMKATSHKYTPLQQFLYFDSLESLPFEVNDCEPTNSRYDPQILVFGRNLVQRIHSLNTFLVGTGAIGCEVLKNWALMGVGSDPKGLITVTDMDSIEKSNLNRQFLFRSSDVSQSKSLIASKAVKVMNPNIKIRAYQDRVCEETEHVFDDDFYAKIDIVTNALDNVEARRYVDRRCVFYCRPLLESGTLGTKGNTQVVLPHLTESYSSTQDPPEKSIPMCTLKNFPSSIEHTIQWARESFETLFTQEPRIYSQYIKDPVTFIEHLRSQAPGSQQESLETLKNYSTNASKTFEDCVVWARNLFQDLFYNRIVQLLHNFPRDCLTSSGVPFWSYPKRCPSPVIFDPSSDLHFGFVLSAANLRSEVFNIPHCRDANLLLKILSTISVENFCPSDNVKIQVNENEVLNNTDENKLEDLYSQLPSLNPQTKSVTGLVFEKDDDTNFHIDYITACSNLRAEAYGIEPANRLKTKGIAGKIIPAVATTTSVVAGLVCLEFYKIAFGIEKIEAYKNGFVNLALPFMAFSEPVAAPKAQFQGKEFTLWDRIDVKGPLTLKSFIDLIEKEHRVSVTIVSCGVCMLFAVFMPAIKHKERCDLTIEELVETASKGPIPSHVKSLTLEILCTDKQGEDVDFPFIRYFLLK